MQLETINISEFTFSILHNHGFFFYQDVTQLKSFLNVNMFTKHEIATIITEFLFVQTFKQSIQEPVKHRNLIMVATLRLNLKVLEVFSRARDLDFSFEFSAFLHEYMKVFRVEIGRLSGHSA